MYEYTAFQDWFDQQTGLTGPEDELLSSFTAARKLKQDSTAMTLEEIQAQITAGDHGEVRIPAGVHKMEPRANGDSNLYISSRKRLKLCGPGALQFPDSEGGIIVTAPNGVPSEDCLIEGVGIFGGKNGITVRASHRITIRDCVIYGKGHADGVGILVEKNSHDVHLYNTSIESREYGISLQTPDSVIRDGVVRRCRVGVYWNGPATQISGVHVFPDIGTETEIGMQIGPWASHLAFADQCYFDNCQLAFLSATGGAWEDGDGPVFTNTYMNSQRHAAAKFVEGELLELRNTMVEKA
jgi:hypothetical protein